MGMKKKGKENEKMIKERLICVALVGGVLDNCCCKVGKPERWRGGRGDKGGGRSERIRSGLK